MLSHIPESINNGAAATGVATATNELVLVLILALVPLDSQHCINLLVQQLQIRCCFLSRLAAER
jgi:hypothetical protein